MAKRKPPTAGALRQTRQLLCAQVRAEVHRLRREIALLEAWLAEAENPIDNSDVEDAAHPSWPEFMERIKGPGSN